MIGVKKIVQYALQKIVGIERYLFCFGLYRAVFKNTFPGKQLKLFVKLAELKEGSIIDVGANVGTNSIYYGREMPDREIVGFEPLALLAATSEKLIRLFKLKNCIIRREGLGNKKEYLPIYTPYEYGVFMHGLTHIIDNEENAHIGIKEAKNQVVAISTLDLYYKMSGFKKIAAIKIDVENHESFVIEGAADVLSTERPFVFMELWNNERKQLSEEAMRTFGYSQMIIENGKLVPAGNTPMPDYFFIPNECVEFVNL